MNRLKTIASALAAAVLALVPQAARSQQPAQLLEFNYGIPTADHATVFVAQDLNLFEKAGLKPKFFYFNPVRRCSPVSRAKAWTSSQRDLR